MAETNGRAKAIMPSIADFLGGGSLEATVDLIVQLIDSFGGQGKRLAAINLLAAYLELVNDGAMELSSKFDQDGLTLTPAESFSVMAALNSTAFRLIRQASAKDDVRGLEGLEGGAGLEGPSAMQPLQPLQSANRNPGEVHKLLLDVHGFLSQAVYEMDADEQLAQNLKARIEKGTGMK